MDKYNISAFILIMQSGLIENNKQEVAGRLLLDSIAMGEDIDVSKDMISNLVKQKNEVHNKIKKASARPEVITNAIHYFEDVVVPDLNPHLTDDICEEIIKLLTDDPSVSDKKCGELTSFYQDGKTSEFLARSFLYAISRPNKKAGIVAEVDDVPLLLEVNNKCPLCQKPLVTSIKDQSIRKYKISEIDPEKGKTSINKIALCISCSLDHQADDVKFAEGLFDIKEESVKHINFQETMDNVSLEFEIRDVIFELVNISSNTEQGEFKLDVMRLDEKILPENIFLLNNLRNDVLKYYRFIEDLLSRVGIYEDVSLDIRKAYNKIQKVYPDQNDVVYYLSDWIFNKTNLSKPAHRRACDIIVAFFVQNCEVFDAII